MTLCGEWWSMIIPIMYSYVSRLGGGGGMGERVVAGHGGLQAYFREFFCHENFIKKS